MTTASSRANSHSPAGAQIRPVLTLSEAGGAPVAETGEKASRLAGLAAKGYRVPDGFVVTAPVFEAVTGEQGHRPDDVADRPGSLAIPESAAAAIREALAALGDGPVAVRSSGVAEDLGDASFAGQYLTELNIEGDDAVLVRRAALLGLGVLPAPARVPRGARNRRRGAAGGARAAHGAGRSRGRRVQCRPGRGRPHDGAHQRCEGDRRTAGVWRSDAGRMARGPEQCADSTAAHENAITEAQAREVAELARRVESELGSPQDIEWAYAGGELIYFRRGPLRTSSRSRSWTSPRAGAG
ncbi:MAG: PEP/pyruvate-binding domain-containing protein [Dehalococcoidia bacterium]|nr:PEP/pyruvate-binding domain-containing protein [Dehalococcoidia bacterium]